MDGNVVRESFAITIIMAGGSCTLSTVLYCNIFSFTSQQLPKIVFKIGKYFISSPQKTIHFTTQLQKTHIWMNGSKAKVMLCAGDCGEAACVQEQQEVVLGKTEWSKRKEGERAGFVVYLVRHIPTHIIFIKCTHTLHGRKESWSKTKTYKKSN